MPLLLLTPPEFHPRPPRARPSAPGREGGAGQAPVIGCAGRRSPRAARPSLTLGLPEPAAQGRPAGQRVGPGARTARHRTAAPQGVGLAPGPQVAVRGAGGGEALMRENK